MSPMMQHASGAPPHALSTHREVGILVWGEAGQEGELLATALARLASRRDMEATVSFEAWAQVRGELAIQRVTIGSGADGETARRCNDVLLALTARSLDRAFEELRPGALVVVADGVPVDSVGKRAASRGHVVLRSPASHASHDSRARGGTLLGAAAALLGFHAGEVAALPAAPGAVVAARAAHAATMERFAGLITSTPGAEHRTPRVLLDGNEALGLGAISAGCSFVASYPMTPATSLSTWFEALPPQAGVTTVAAEDEIAAVALAIGAGYAGARALTATSGGGLALMTESIGFAAMAEIPVVVVDVMRAGPSTGMPTRTEQGDLLFAVHLAHGDFPHIVLAPGSTAECFALGARAFELAERFQCPVIVLSDASLATTRRAVPRALLRGKRATAHPADTAHPGAIGQPFARYAPTEGGLSPRTLPGTPGGEHVASSYEHDALGHIDESSANRQLMVARRERKLEGARAALRGPVRSGAPEACLTLVCWGSSAGACRAAAARATAEGTPVDVLHFSELWPLPRDLASRALRACRRTLLVEQNATGQLGLLLRQETGIELGDRLLQTDGRPLDPEAIDARVRALLTTPPMGVR